MKDIIKTALSIGLNIGLSDRETFVKQVSEVINQYQQDPSRGDQWAHSLTTYLEQLRNNINLENAISGAMGHTDMPDQKSISDLTTALRELTDQLKQTK